MNRRPKVEESKKPDPASQLTPALHNKCQAQWIHGIPKNLPQVQPLYTLEVGKLFYERYLILRVNSSSSFPGILCRDMLTGDEFYIKFVPLKEGNYEASMNSALSHS